MRWLLAGIMAALVCQGAGAAFVEEFKSDKLAVDPSFQNGWGTLAGSGEATVSFTQKNHHGFMTVDARKDMRNIYWALIKRSISPGIDKVELQRPDREIRVEVKLRISDAPRRVHFQVNHSRTTNVHLNLREFDLPDTGWHVISYTTKDFDATPEDDITFSLGMTDMGRAIYSTEIAYVKAEVVDPAKSGPDLGPPLRYRPAMPQLSSFTNALAVSQDAIIDSAWPGVNFRDWMELNPDEGTLGVKVLAVSGTQVAILRFDMAKFKGKTADGWGVVELTTASTQWAPTDLEEFGYLRTVEIKNTAPDFERNSVTWDSLFQGRPVLEVLNGQLIYDVQPALQRAGKTRISINPAVMQRLIDGTTKGLAVYPQGAVTATFASSQAPGRDLRPTLYFNVK